jgi:hypothetical protein
MRERGGRFDPVESEVEGVEERRRRCERMDRGADVVLETGECQFGGARSASDGLTSLEDEDRAAGLREGDGRGEPVWARADDDGV